MTTPRKPKPASTEGPEANVGGPRGNVGGPEPDFERLERDFEAPKADVGGPEPDMVKVMVTLTRPAPADLKSVTRAQRFRLLQVNSEKRRAELMAWLRHQGLDEQVAEVGEPTAFNVLFVTATWSVVRRLPDAPGVVSVKPGVNE